MPKKAKIYFYLFFLTCFSFCTKENKVITPAYYHWKTNLEITPRQAAYLDSLGVHRLYLRFFDVDLVAGEAQPVSEINYNGKDSLHYEIVPVVFITNRTFQSLDIEKSRQLAALVYNKIKYLREAKLKCTIQEIQVDCDWSQTTRDRYFAFLEALAKLTSDQKLDISATIRLHQVKFAGKTGVPPVRSGMLMWYNTGELTDINETNSILNDQKTKAYLSGFDDYPLSLDVVFPVFSWGVLFRDGQFELLLHPLTKEEMADTAFFKPGRPDYFTILKNGYFKGHYLYAGDEIRLEKVSQNQLTNAAEQVKHLLKQDSFRLAFYHLDEMALKYYPASFLKSL